MTMNNNHLTLVPRSILENVVVLPSPSAMNPDQEKKREREREREKERDQDVYQYDYQQKWHVCKLFMHLSKYIVISPSP